MPLSNRQILTLLNLKELDRSYVLKLMEYAYEQNITVNDYTDFYTFYSNCYRDSIVNLTKDYTHKELEQADNNACEILDSCRRKGIKTVSFYDELFPKNFRLQKDPPIFLYYKGNITRVNRKSVAIIGTRQILSDAYNVGMYVSKEFSKAGFNIVSGLAEGCDTVAHLAALQTNGTTIAILGSGFDYVYPINNKNLANDILDNGGLILTEYSPDTVVSPKRLIERDRLQAGLADATVIIQCPVKSGTMHTVKSTIENNKPLLAIQYNNIEMQSNVLNKGNELLISTKKAHPLTSNNLKKVINRLLK